MAGLLIYAKYFKVVLQEFSNQEKSAENISEVLHFNEKNNFKIILFISHVSYMPISKSIVVFQT